MWRKNKEGYKRTSQSRPRDVKSFGRGGGIIGVRREGNQTMGTLGRPFHNGVKREIGEANYKQFQLMRERERFVPSG